MSNFTEKQRHCEAITHKGSQCKKPSICIDGVHQRFCLQHSSAPGGAPIQNLNALKSGIYTAEAKKQRRQLRDFLAQTKATLAMLTDTIEREHEDQNS